jgi:hypothetical protein
MLIASDETADSHEKTKGGTTLKHNFTNCGEEAVTTVSSPDKGRQEGWLKKWIMN